MKQWFGFSSGLKRKLLIAYLSIALLGVLFMILSLIIFFQLKENVFLLINANVPFTQTTKNIQINLQTSLAALRGWMSFRDKRFIEERKVAWKDGIIPNLNILKQLAIQYNNKKVLQMVNELSKTLSNLKALQWKIEDVAQVPGNYPSNIFMKEHLEPVSKNLISFSTELLDEKKAKETQYNINIVFELSDFRSDFTNSFSFLVDYILTGDLASLNNSEKFFMLSKKSIEKLKKSEYDFSMTGQDTLNQLVIGIHSYEKLVNELIRIKNERQSNLAAYWLSKEALPLARDADQLLNNIATLQAKNLGAVTQKVQMLSQVNLYFLFGFIPLLLIISIWLALYNASKILGPIRLLLQGTKALAEGHLKEDIPVKTHDELGELTASFNEMRIKLINSEEKLKRYATQLEQSNQALDDFAYIASHDLKEPLRGISNFSEFLLEDYEEKLDQNGKDQLRTLKKLSQRMELLINTLLTYSRVGRLDLSLKNCDINEIIQDKLNLLSLYLKEKKVDVKIVKTMPIIVCDKARIGEVFYNIIVNAVKYNAKEHKKIIIDFVEKKDRYVFFIKDNGIGIAKEDFDKIFKIFKRLHGRDEYEGGTGAGMTIVKKIIERHNGKIWLESEKGKGTTFYFSISKLLKPITQEEGEHHEQ